MRVCVCVCVCLLWELPSLPFFQPGFLNTSTKFGLNSDKRKLQWMRYLMYPLYPLKIVYPFYPCYIHIYIYIHCPLCGTLRPQPLRFHPWARCHERVLPVCRSPSVRWLDPGFLGPRKVMVLYGFCVGQRQKKLWRVWKLLGGGSDVWFKPQDHRNVVTVFM